MLLSIIILLLKLFELDINLATLWAVTPVVPSQKKNFMMQE